MAVGFGSYGKAFRRFTDRERREYLRAYYACVSFTDAQVGRVLDALDRHQLWERTLVVFMSDHGFHLGEREWWSKNTLFERSCRAPLMVAGPGIQPGRARGLVEAIDLYPTLVDLCQLRHPTGWRVPAFARLLEDSQAPGKPFAYTMVSRGHRDRGDSIRTDRWRYTQWSDGSRELYDHEVDPEECQNLAGLHERVGTEKEMRRLLDRVHATQD